MRRLGSDGLSRPTRAGLWGSAIGFLVASGILALFGVRDLFGPTVFSVRLRAAIMLATAGFIAAGAIAVLKITSSRHASPATGGLSLAAGLTTLVAGVLPMLYQLIAGDLTVWIAIWCAIAVIGLGSFAFLFRIGLRIPYPRQFAAALSVTAVLSAGNFVYTSVYQPAVQPAQFSLAVKLEKGVLNRDKTIINLPVTVSFVNTGKVPLYVLASTYNVLGTPGSFTPQEQSQDEINRQVYNGKAQSYRVLDGDSKIIQSDRFIFEGTRLESGDQVNVDRVVEVPLPSQFRKLGVNAWALVVRADDLSLRSDASRPTEFSWDPKTGRHLRDAPEWAAGPGVDWVRYSIPIHETDFLRTQTRRPWTADIWRVLGNPVPGRPPGSYISLRFHPTGTTEHVSFETAERDNQMAAERYGVIRSNTGMSERSSADLGLDN